MSVPTHHPRTRLELELEFIQCLANPIYLTHLAHTKIHEDPRFLAYIDYLEYFRQPEYAKLLTYPVYSLAALTLLKQATFREDIKNPAVAGEILNDMVRRFAGFEVEEEKASEKEEENGMQPGGVDIREANGNGNGNGV